MSNMENMVVFYRDIVGLQTQWNGGDFAEFETSSDEFSFFMYSREAFVLTIGESCILLKGINQPFEIAWWLRCFTDVDAEYERLSKLGVQFPTEASMTFSFGIRNFYVAGFEGNLLEIGSTREM